MQPSPKREGEEVPSAYRAWAKRYSVDKAVILSEERDRFGQEKYGQPLMTGDGRDTFQDSREEMGDLLHYLFKAKMQGGMTSEQLGELSTLWQTAGQLIADLASGLP